MPRLSKIRLTGCKYEGLQKEHENSIFDLSREDMADHTLFTLCNGGGKGVMMQLIFQILLPETRWGNNNGNKVISMFYDKRNNLHPFTFHVVLEWILDTVPEKRLITGIAVKSIMKNTSNEDENKTGLSYFLYTHEYENKGIFTVETLPLYDKNKKEAVDIDLLEDFISNNKRDFIKYSKSSVRRSDSDYYNYLENRGIYRSEWLKLKEINKSEGGVGDYFKGAGDNKSIFDKIIIPAISENIKNYSYDDGDNLIQMFKSNLSITKDLPVLIKREGDYKELLNEIKPLIQNADIGSRFIDKRERLIAEGSDIYFILNDEYISVEKEIEKWQVELKKAEDEKADLLYKRDNLYYNLEKSDVESKERQASSLQEELKEKIGEIEDKTQEEILYKVNKVLYNRRKVENEIQNKTIEKEKLIQAMDLSDIEERVEQLDSEIEIEWDKNKESWMEIENQYSAYINYTDRIKIENKDKKNKYWDKVSSLQNEVNKFLLKEEDLEKKKKILAEDYDALSLAFPDRISEDLKASREDLEGKIDLLSQEINRYNKNISQIGLEIVKFKYKLEERDKTIESLNKTLIDQEKYELDLTKKIAKQLIENQEGGLLSHNWFNKKLDKLESLKREKNTKLESVQRNIWEKNIDKILNKEDYFIANKDILSIKEEIKRINIDVQTGTEYLNEISQEDKLEILKDNPGFIYSLVISNKRDWDIIDKNIHKDIFINNMVAIYIRSEMKKEGHKSFKTIQGREYDLLDREKFFTWKSEMAENILQLTNTEKNIKADLANIESLIQEIKVINTKDTALELNKKINIQKEEKLELLEKIRLVEEEKLEIENKIIISTNNLTKNSQKHQLLLLSIEKIENYIEKLEEVQIERLKIEKIKEDISQLKKEIQNLEEDSDEIASNVDLTKDSYWQWKRRIGIIIEDAKHLYKDFSYDYKVNENYSNYRPPNFISLEDRLKTLISERKVIEEDINTKNTSIAVLDVEIKALDKERNRYIEELGEISPDWNKMDSLSLSLNEINIKLSNLKKDIKTSKEERTKIKSQVDSIKGKIEIMKKQLSTRELNILNSHKRAAVSLLIEDMDSHLDNVKRDIESNKRYLYNCEEALERNKNKKWKFDINLSKIKNGYPLEINKGKTSKILKDKLEENPDTIVEEWLRSCENNRGRINETIDDGEKIRNRFVKEVGNKLEENKLREKITSTIKEANIENFKNNIISFDSMEKHFQREILRLSKDKNKAEESMKQWSDRASMHVIKMIEALDNMVNSMNYINEQGNAFPLVKLKGKERLPKEKSEITHILDEYFIQSISKVLEMDRDIYNIDDRELKDLMGDKAIFSKALQGRYPTLLVYKMSEKNEFRYAKARDEYYTTWEAINKGEGDQPEGSGGQTLSVNTFVIMMIMSFKKKHIGNENPSTVLILDNPFGKASAKHVLDPIFEIADRLNFQLICFAAPEIIKVEISERFPVFWELKIEEGKIIHGGRVIK